MLWASLSDVLPLLAEAAPSEFLEAVRVGSASDSPLLRDIFGDTSGGGSNALTTDSAHTGLLWALETCVWSPDHSGLVVDILARLSEIDPGGRLANRPFASLEAIFRPWYPQNTVSPERRLAAIDGLRDRHPAVAWRLLFSLLPEMHGVSMNISEPHFREWKPERIGVTPQEYWSFIDEVCSRVLEDLGHDAERWLALIERLDDLPPAARTTALERLDELSATDMLRVEGRTAIWEALRAKVARHREYATAKWALPPDQVDVIEATAVSLEPADPLKHRGWLFKEHAPEIPDIKRGDNYDEYMQALAKVRAEAAAEIAAATDWERLRDFAASGEVPWVVGIALAQAAYLELESE